MRRPSPITVGLVVLVSVVVVALLAILGSHSAKVSRPAATPIPEPDVDQDRDTRPPRMASPSTATATPDPSANLPGDGPDHRAIMRKRQTLNAVHQQELIREADEQVFAAMALPEDRRVAIRQLNELSWRQVLGKLASQPEATTTAAEINANLAIANQADIERRNAIAALFDAEAAKRFRAAERETVRNLSPMYRQRWADELRKEAPLPPPPNEGSR